MRLGFFPPQLGPLAGPDALTRVAQRAEEIGFDSLWVTERSLFPLELQTPYPVGDMPEHYKFALDPLDALGFLAGQTSRIALGTSVLILPWYSPVLLARRLATLDLLSNGRLRVGVGVGWSKDEYDVAGTEWGNRGKRMEEALQALKVIWTTDPVEFEGQFYSIPRSIIGLKPVQKPHPPIYMAAYVPAALARVARHADAWHPVGIPLSALPEMFAGVQAMAGEAGRDPAALELAVRAYIFLSDQPLGDDRSDFTGTPEQISSDIARAREIGVSELMFDVTLAPDVRSVEDILERMELLSQLSKESLAGSPA